MEHNFRIKRSDVDRLVLNVDKKQELWITQICQILIIYLSIIYLNRAVRKNKYNC